jgi:YbbR domain-containing protein
MLKLLDNLWAKLFALLIGVLIWFHVATEKTYNYEVRLPITKVDLKENLVLSQLVTDTVMATVSATGKQLLREKWVSRGTRLSAVSYGVGQHQVTLSPSNLFLADNAAGIRIYEVLSPATVTLDIDNQFVSRVKVMPALEATADNGFAVTRLIEISPEEITVVGPRSSVKELKSLSTESRKLTGLRTDAIIKLAIAPPAGKTIRFAPDSVTLTVRVVPVKTRTYDHLQVVVFNSPPGSAVATEPSFIALDLAGSPEDIDLLNRNALTVSVDYRQMSALKRARIKVDCPSGFRVARLSIDSVTIAEGP